MKAHKTVVLALLVVVLAFAGCAQQADQPQPDAPPQQQTGVAATVNGEEISTQEVQALQAELAQQAQTEVSEQQALEVAIQQVLLSQEAQRQGIQATREDVEALFEEQMQLQGQSLDDLKEQLGPEYDQFVESYQQQLTIQELINSQQAPAIPDEQVRAFYDENTEEFIVENETLSFEEVEEDIRVFLEQQTQSQVLEQLTAQLREDADITVY